MGIVFLAVGFILGGLGLATAAQQPAQDSKDQILHELEINRALLLRFRAEAERLKAQARQQSTRLVQTEIENTEYKIKAVSDDGSNLISALPREEQAREFLKYLTAKTAKIRPAATEPAEAISPPPASAGQAPKETVPPKERTYAMHERALELVGQDRLREAVKIYEDIVLMDPSDDQAYMIMGHTYMLLGDFNRSARAFENGIEIDHQNASSILPFYQNMVLKNPGDDKAHTYIGYVYLMLGDAEKAGAAFKDALAINPNNAAAANGLQIAARPQ